MSASKKSINTPSFKQILTNPWHFFAFGFGSGLSPKAPGTVGTLAAIPLWWAMQSLPFGVLVGIITVSFVLGVWVCAQSSRQLQVHDHPGIVWDEFVGYWITMLAAPKEWWWIIVGFGLFRFFDIIKPWPIGWVDRRVKGGFGIMVDDAIAGILAALVLYMLTLLVV
ncbi:phosphatidylglycerophosphatase A [Marinibactrum halimedae]|uniref:Phosphatidylglycerophosphatase A n=1 Tax=Marinibactrum halimedae TaxID=1444977 RepID=A0AA37T916_9GAMM|nr:phosphatidylglycerophosphatase A [Marinibactrum halimedae]MCD9460523.1 phosphatidylglycerophosphatase A [Marinibactrum halimedae]GLS27886.1 phosphatidylglycerophosphatase A [Marinibactrum halimedae]